MRIKRCLCDGRASRLLAINLVAYPEDLGMGISDQEILRGGAEKVKEAGAVIAGGHSISDAGAQIWLVGYRCG